MFGHHLAAQLAQTGDDGLHQHLGRGGTGGDTDRLDSRQPTGLDHGGVVDEVGLGAHLLGQLPQAVGVGGVARPHHQHGVHQPGHLPHRILAVLGGVADVILARPLDLGEVSPQCIDHVRGLIHAEGGLGHEAEIVRVLHLEFGHVCRRLHQIHAALAILVLPHGTDHLRVAGVADEHGFGALAAGAMDLHVHLGHQRTGGIEHLERAGLGHLAYRLGDAVGGEDDDAVVRHLIQLLDEDGARLLELVHHVAVVHHFMTDIDGGTELLQRTLDDADGAVDTGTEAAGICEQDIHQSTFSSSSTPRISTSKVTV